MNALPILDINEYFSKYVNNINVEPLPISDVNKYFLVDKYYSENANNMNDEPSPILDFNKYFSFDEFSKYNNDINAFNDTTNVLKDKKTNHSESDVVEFEPISDAEESTRMNKKKCEICGLRGHNACTCSTESDAELESDNDIKEISKNKQKCEVYGLERHNT
ncbi:1667_t:CDS:2 [Dentiscutata heterogama]|uniref:1667_t:CDS:1 n=1 Tax=Dentiscutata heterogama TaxID=1316150 RepID=A0ACA9LER1_9GLOM|nr:1667_t:CDS:2 [Dentiscutata heterogama]